jgi:hemolysin activation/secretion protein
VISHDSHNSGASGRLSGHALELSARGENLAASVTFAHSLERPAAFTEGERPVYFRLDVFF